MIAAGRDARDMWLAALTYCARHLTDGYFHQNLLPSLAVMAGVDVANCQTFANALLDVGLWEIEGDVYHIHDYTDYNPTKEQAETTKKARAEAGRAGGVAKASKTSSKVLAKPLAKSKQKSAPYPYPSLINTDPSGANAPAPPEEKPKKPKREKTPPDERLKHPALIAYQQEARLSIPISWRDEVITTVMDAGLWTRVVHQWIGNGWNKQNIRGMLESYRAGGIQKPNGHNGAPSPTAVSPDNETPEEYAARRKATIDAARARIAAAPSIEKGT